MPFNKAVAAFAAVAVWFPLACTAANVTMPNVAGQPIDQAKALISNVGLPTPSILKVFSSVQPKDNVVAQVPAAGTSVPDNSPVILTISSGMPRGVEALFGVSSTFGHNVSDYSVLNGFLTSKNVGNVSPQALVGLGFGLFQEGDPTRLRSRLSVFVSAQFSNDTNNTLTGYTAGVGFRMSPYMHLMVGYSLFPTSVPSQGFKSAAASFVSATKDTSYSAFKAANLQGDGPGIYDGFPVPPATTAGPGFAYGGAVLETKYRQGLVLGLVFPISIRSLFQGN